jgi:hypothetical protein
MRGARVAGGVITVSVVLFGLGIVGAQGVWAANPGFRFYGQAAGTLLRSPDGTATPASGESLVLGGNVAQTQTAQAASVAVQQVATIGSVTTSAQVVRVKGGRRVIAIARADGVRILNGLVSAQRVTTTSMVTEIKRSADHERLD